MAIVPALINGVSIPMTRGDDNKTVSFAVGAQRTRITGQLVAVQGTQMSDGTIASASETSLITRVEGQLVIAVGSPFTTSDGYSGVVPAGAGPSGKTVLLG